MCFGDGVKDKIREMRADKNHNGIKKELLKIRLGGGYEKLEFQEKVDVVYYLARYAYVDDKREILKEYLNELENLFKTKNIDDYKVEYYRYLWLMINTNYKEMHKEDVIDAMMEIHNFYKNIGVYDLALAAITSIYGIYGEGDKILESLKCVMQSSLHVEEDILNSFLDGLVDLDQELYIEGKNLIEDYINQSVVV